MQSRSFTILEKNKSSMGKGPPKYKLIYSMQQHESKSFNTRLI